MSEVWFSWHSKRNSENTHKNPSKCSVDLQQIVPLEFRSKCSRLRTNLSCLFKKIFIPKNVWALTRISSSKKKTPHVWITRSGRDKSGITRAAGVLVYWANLCSCSSVWIHMCTRVKRYVRMDRSGIFALLNANTHSLQPIIKQRMVYWYSGIFKKYSRCGSLHE